MVAVVEQFVGRAVGEAVRRGRSGAVCMSVFYGFLKDGVDLDERVASGMLRWMGRNSFGFGVCAGGLQLLVSMAGLCLMGVLASFRWGGRLGGWGF